MYSGQKVIDILRHHSISPQFRACAYNIIALRQISDRLQIPEGTMQEAQDRHLKMMDEREIDMQFISARPCAMGQVGFPTA